MREPPVAPF